MKFFRAVALSWSAVFVGSVTLIALTSQPAHALLELRGNLGLAQATPSNLNNGVAATVGNNDLNITGASTYGADAIFKFPMSHIGIGVRYENWDQKKTTANYGAPGVAGSGELTMSRWAAILTVRPIDTLVYFGLIGTYGLSQTIDYKMGPNSGITDYKAGSGTTYSAGLEGGVKVGFFRLGVETGYESVVGSGMASTTNANSKINDLNMAGFYGNVTLGFGI